MKDGKNILQKYQTIEIPEKNFPEFFFVFYIKEKYDPSLKYIENFSGKLFKQLFPLKRGLKCVKGVGVM